MTSNYEKRISSSTILSILWLTVPVMLCGCRGGVNRAEISDLYSEHASFRAVALCRVAQENNTEHLARQIELLADEDPAVRFYAISSLKKLTGLDNGYDYRQSSDLRQAAIRRWQSWLADRTAESGLVQEQDRDGIGQK